MLFDHIYSPIYLQNAATFNIDPMPDAEEEEISNYPQGLVLIPRGTDENSVVVGPHIRGSRLRASSAGDEEVDLLLPGTARCVMIPISSDWPLL